MDQVNLAIQRVLLFTSWQVCLPGSVHASGMCGQSAWGWHVWQVWKVGGRERERSCCDGSKLDACIRALFWFRQARIAECGRAPAPILAWLAPGWRTLLATQWVAGCWPEPGGQASSHPGDRPTWRNQRHLPDRLP